MDTLMPATNLIATRTPTLARSFLLRSTLIFSLASVACFSASSLAGETTSPLSKTNALVCGGSEVLIQTACVASSDGAPPPCTQKLTFKKTDARDGPFINYVPKPVKNRDEPFVYQLSCNSRKRDFYVIAHSSNFGNCSTCEWMDVYTTHGRLMGSTPSATRSLQLPRKKLSKNLERLLDGSQESNSISVDRVVPTK
ncbi:hypothetical protein QTH89_10535 [Variovorax sp. J22G21]|uniref:hypothetical protein n=2 Tax=Variovorax fucosicus TaxID=3053517 RepID=UPI00257616B1|nr:hypothetical protein [Variovorax sp. J22G21]MDM0061638.1 hypothetical protein [Variovorax sp. J22G21]